MKSSFMAKHVFASLSVLAIVYCFQSCNEKEVPPDPTAGLTKISEGYASGAAAEVEIWAPEKLFAGYNRIFIALYDSVSKKRITDSHVHLFPLMDMHTMTHSCPVENPEPLAENGLFPAGVVFTMPSGDMGTWSMEVKVHNHLNNLSGNVMFNIDVAAATPPKVIAFLADNDKRYYLSYHFQNKLKVGVNDVEIIAFVADGSDFVPEENLTIRLVPEMPSMGHGSPNNTDPVHVKGGHYAGKVNFTMTGDWRLNLELSDSTGILATKFFDVLVE